MAKRIRVSDDAGSNWYTLPGNSAELSNEAGEIDDTIFGQDFGSTQTGLIGWSISANGLYKGFAGYAAKILKAGTPTQMTGEAMSVVTGKTYQITNSAKRTFDRNQAITVKDNGSPVSASNIESIDHLFGRVTFVSGYSVVGSITVDAYYLPLAQVGKANGFTLSQTANANDNTDYETAQGNSGHRTYTYGLKTVSLDVSGIYDATNGFVALLRARTELIIEINPDGNSKSVARGYFKPVNTGQSGDVGDLESETITFNLSVPDDETVQVPFKWLHADDTTLNTAVIKALTAWEANTTLLASYLPNGTTGFSGQALITDITLSGGLEVMNEFTIGFQGSGLPAAFPADAPTGYSVGWFTDPIDENNDDAAGFTIVGGAVGYGYTYTITDTDSPVNTITGSGVMSGENHTITGIDISAMVDGDIEVAVVLSNAGTAGSEVTDTVTKTTS